MTSQPSDKDPKRIPLFNPIPEPIIFLVGFILGVELILLGGTYDLWGGPEAVGWRIALLEKYAFSDRLFESLFTIGFVSFDKIVRCVSYVFISEHSLLAIIGSLFALGTGKYVADRTTIVTLIVLFVIPVSVGAVVFSLLANVEDFMSGPLVVAFGFFGFYAFRESVAASWRGASRLRPFTMPILILTIDITISLITGQPPFWIARAAAFVAGLVLSLFVSWQGGVISLKAAKRHLRRK